MALEMLQSLQLDKTFSSTKKLQQPVTLTPTFLFSCHIIYIPRSAPTF